MNYFFYIIIGILLFGFILELLTSLLNLKALDPEIPEEFRDTFDPERYRKSQDYTRENTRFSLIESSTGLLALILFITFGGFNYVDIAARNITPEGDHPILNGLVFAGLLSLITGAFSLPFSLYSTFVIEERYGFNKTTLKTFIMDRVKGMILGALIASAILSVILWFFEFAGDAAWLYCWGAVVVFTLFIQYISPVVIMPLFNKFTPLEQGELRDMILDYAERESFKLKGIFTMDGSKRTSKANAFFTGFGRYKRIVFFDNLTEKLSNSEILAVLAHEMGHFKLRHIFKLLVFSVLQTGLMFYILSL
ncbi:MAG: M48 family metallopeptidase, partial [Chitinivibrionales bacterium]